MDPLAEPLSSAAKAPSIGAEVVSFARGLGGREVGEEPGPQMVFDSLSMPMYIQTPWLQWDPSADPAYSSLPLGSPHGSGVESRPSRPGMSPKMDVTPDPGLKGDMVSALLSPGCGLSSCRPAVPASPSQSGDESPQAVRGMHLGQSAVRPQVN